MIGRFLVPFRIESPYGRESNHNSCILRKTSCQNMRTMRVQTSIIKLWMMTAVRMPNFERLHQKEQIPTSNYNNTHKYIQFYIYTSELVKRLSTSIMSSESDRPASSSSSSSSSSPGIGQYGDKGLEAQGTCRPAM